MLVMAVGLPAAGLMILFDLPLMALGAVVDLPPAVTGLYSLFISIIADVAVLHLARQAITRDEPPSARVALGAATARYGTFVGARFVTNFVIGLWTVLLVVPGILKALSFFLMLPTVIHENVSGEAARSISEDRMNGRRGTLFAAMCGLAVPIVVWVVVLIGVNVALVAAQGEAAEPGLASKIASIAFAIGFQALLMPFALLQAVAYAKLTSSSYELSINQN